MKSDKSILLAALKQCGLESGLNERDSEETIAIKSLENCLRKWPGMNGKPDQDNWRINPWKMISERMRLNVRVRRVAGMK